MSRRNRDTLACEKARRRDDGYIICAEGDGLCVHSKWCIQEGRVTLTDQAAECRRRAQE